jgi:exopolysaccharide production protein ExoZ
VSPVCSTVVCDETGNMAKQHAELATVQALRAIAALLVVTFHSIDIWGRHVLGRPADQIWPNGSVGVDIFFVISGLVMVMSADRLAGRPGAWRVFLRQRITRIVPLYWIMTTAKVVAVLALPTLVMRTRLDLPYIVGSYAFWPVRDWTGAMFPVLPVGWTLTYEMLFYALVAVALALQTPVLAVAGPTLVAFALVAIVGDPSGFANTIVAEFLFGVLIGVSIKRAIRLPLIAAVFLLGLGFAVVLTGPVVTAVLRPITWGIPAACIVAGSVALEEKLSGSIPRWLLHAGDASYSIYLMHLFVTPVIYIVVSRSIPATLWLPAIISLSLLASVGVGRLGFVWIERPLLRWLRRPPVAPTVAIAG